MKMKLSDRAKSKYEVRRHFRIYKCLYKYNKAAENCNTHRTDDIKMNCSVRVTKKR